MGGQSEALSLLEAMAPTIVFKEFATAFPDPKQKSPAPSQAQLDSLLGQKAEFTNKQRAVNMDLVRHPYLSSLLEEGNQDVRLVERWVAALKADSK